MSAVLYNPILLNMINVWGEVQNHLKRKKSHYIFSPVWGNVNLMPGRKDSGFRLWAEKDCGKLKNYTKKVF